MEHAMSVPLTALAPETGPSGERRGFHPGAVAYVVAVLAFLFSPLVVMVLFSFHSSPRLSFPIAGFSARWYREILGDPLVIQAAGRTALAAVVTAATSGILGLTAALGLVRIRQRLRGIILTVALVPLTFPVLLFAIGLATFYHQLGVGFSIWATIAGHVVVALPFVFLVIGAALEQFRFSLLEAAYDLGASRARAFLTVTLPIILPAVIGSMLLAMAISVDEFVIAFFTAGQAKTLPMLMYGRLNLGVKPNLNAIGTTLLVVTTGLAFLSARKTTLKVH